jgi:iron(III)-enterobactin esterase
MRKLAHVVCLAVLCSAFAADASAQALYGSLIGNVTESSGKPGRYVKFPDETPITNLYASMLDRMGVPVGSVGDSNGRLEGLSGQRGQSSPALSILVDGEFTIKPPFGNAPELIINNGIPHGTIHRFTMKSADSKFYKGGSRGQPGVVVPFERPMAVYVPAQYVPGTAAPFIVVQDGYNPKYHLTVPTVLDNLIAQKRVPVMIAVLVQPGNERSLEYDTVSDTYTQFIETEVLPKVAKDYNVTFTKDPDGRAAMGGSSGAACAFTMAWFHPELYRRVLSYSGSFTNLQSPVNPAILRGAWEYHAALIPKAETKPIRVWMEFGGNDLGATLDEASYRNWVLANQHMAAALKAKGYHYRYVFAEGAWHTDTNVIYQTLPQALEYIWAGYPIK